MTFELKISGDNPLELLAFLQAADSRLSHPVNGSAEMPSFPPPASQEATVNGLPLSEVPVGQAPVLATTPNGTKSSGTRSRKGQSKQGTDTTASTNPSNEEAGSDDPLAALMNGNGAAPAGAISQAGKKQNAAKNNGAPTAESVRAAAKEAIDNNMQMEVRAELVKLGATSISTLQPEHYGAFLDALATLQPVM